MSGSRPWTTGDREWQRKEGRGVFWGAFRDRGFCDIRAGVAGLSEFVRDNGTKSIVHSLPEARFSGGTSGHLALQRAATRARCPPRLLAPYVFPVSGEIIFLGEEEIGHGGLIAEFRPLGCVGGGSRTGREKFLSTQPFLHAFSCGGEFEDGCMGRSCGSIGLGRGQREVVGG